MSTVLESIYAFLSGDLEVGTSV